MHATDPWRILPVVLSILATGGAGGLILWDLIPPYFDEIMPVNLIDSVLPSAGVALAVVVATAGTALCSHMAAQKHAVLVHWTAVFGILPMMTLAFFEPSCNPLGSVMLGFTAAASCAGVGWTWNRVQSDESQTGNDTRRLTALDFVRWTTTFYLSVVAAFALAGWISEDLSIDLFGKILLFCGIGITAAAALKGEWDSRQMIALIGVGISIAGAAIEMHIGFHNSETPYDDWHILLVAAFVSLTLILPLALHSLSGAIRQIGVVVGAALVGAFTLVMSVGIGITIPDICGSSVTRDHSGVLLVFGCAMALTAAVAGYATLNRIYAPP